MRNFAAVMFRRMASKTRKLPGNDSPRELFLTLQDGQRLAIRQKLLACLNSEYLANLRNKVGDAVAEIARQYYEDGRLNCWNRPGMNALIWRSTQANSGQNC